MYNEVKAAIQKIKTATLGLEVRKLIAEGLEKTLEYEKLHEDNIKKDLDSHKNYVEDRLDNQDNELVAIDKRIWNIVGYEGTSNIEVVDAREGFDCLRDRLQNMESIGGPNNRTVYIYNAEGEVIGYFNNTGAYINNFEAGEINADNIITAGPKLNTVVVVEAGADIQQAISELDKYLRGNILINLQAGEYYGNVHIEGFSGGGNIQIQFDPATVLYGSIYVVSSSVEVIIDGATTGKIIHQSNYESIVRGITSSFVDVRNIVLEGLKNQTRFGVSAARGTAMRVGDCKILNCNKTSNVDAGAVYSTHSSMIYAINNIGLNNTCSLVASMGGIINATGKTPMATKDKHIATAGIINGSVNMESTEDTSPESPEVIKTVKFGATAYKSYRAADGWKNGIYQGKYNSKNPASYNYYGLYIIDSADVKAKLANKTIKSVKLTVKRKTEGQGIGQPSNASLKLYTTTSTGSGSTPALSASYGTSIGTVAKGKSLTVTISKDVIKNILAGHKALMLHQPTGSNYCLMENTMTLEVQYV